MRVTKLLSQNNFILAILFFRAKLPYFFLWIQFSELSLNLFYVWLLWLEKIKIWVLRVNQHNLQIWLWRELLGNASIVCAWQSYSPPLHPPHFFLSLLGLFFIFCSIFCFPSLLVPFARGGSLFSCTVFSSFQNTFFSLLYVVFSLPFITSVSVQAACTICA